MIHFLLNSRTLVMLNESTVPVGRWRRHVRSSLHTVMCPLPQAYRCLRSKWLCSIVCQQEQTGDDYDAQTKQKPTGLRLVVVGECGY